MLYIRAYVHTLYKCVNVDVENTWQLLCFNFSNQECCCENCSKYLAQSKFLIAIFVHSSLTNVTWLLKLFRITIARDIFEKYNNIALFIRRVQRTVSTPGLSFSAQWTIWNGRNRARNGQKRMQIRTIAVH